MRALIVDDDDSIVEVIRDVKHTDTYKNLLDFYNREP